jgi:hypothetical protein
MPDNKLRYFAQQVCKIFGLGIVHFETIKSGDPGDWMDFLMEEKAVQIIQEIDQEIFFMIEHFCNDIKATFEVLPYYARCVRQSAVLSFYLCINSQKYLILSFLASFGSASMMTSPTLWKSYT